MAERKFKDNVEASRFELEIEGGVAFIDYVKNGDIYDLTHTEVPEQVEGRGFGGKVARFALEQIQAEGGHVIPSCPFVKSYIERVPEFKKLVK